MMKSKHVPFFHALAVALVLAAAAPFCLTGGHALAEDDEFANLLDTKRWRESSFGVSLRPPLGTTLSARTYDDALVRIAKTGEYAFSVYIKSTQQELNIDNVVRTAIEQFGFAQPTSKIMEQRVVKPAKRPGWLIYFGGNLPASADKQKRDPERDVEALKAVARTQMETAAMLMKKKGQDLDAYRIYKAVAQNSPDAEMRKKAAQHVAAFEVDRGFIARYLADEARRSKVNDFVNDKRPWVVGQAFMQLSPQNFVTIQMECAYDKFESSKETFEAVIRSIDVQHPDDLNKVRKQLIDRGEVIRKTFSFDKIKASLLPEVTVPIVDDAGKPAGVAPLRLQYLRVVDGTEDRGWMKVVHRLRRDEIIRLETKVEVDPKTGRKKYVKLPVEREAGVNGVGIDVYYRLILGPTKAIDTHSQLFLSQDGNYESWATRTTVREHKDPAAAALEAKTSKLQPTPPVDPKKAPAPAATQVTYMETGVRTYDEITIIREGPSGVERFAWRKPHGYISQVELMQLSGLLPRQDEEYGFYAYHPQTGSVSFRTVRIVSEGDNGFRLYSRPTPDSPEQMSDYDKAGALTRRALSENRDVIPTTREELAKLYKIDLPDDTVAAPPLPTETKPLPPNRVPR